jgi:hypothetical protein
LPSIKGLGRSASMILAGTVPCRPIPYRPKAASHQIPCRRATWPIRRAVSASMSPSIRSRR